MELKVFHKIVSDERSKYLKEKLKDLLMKEEMERYANKWLNYIENKTL